jgi:hypothetical protein
MELTLPHADAALPHTDVALPAPTPAEAGDDALTAAGDAPATDPVSGDQVSGDLPVVRTPSPSPHEVLSPFIGYDPDASALPEALLDIDGRVPLAVDLLRDPDAVVARILDPDEVASTVLGASLIIPLCGAFFTVVAMSPWADTTDMALGAVLAPTNLLLAIATALGPAWGVSVVMAVRVPLSRLVACMLASVAAASLLMLALSPLPYALWKVDDHWAGPLALFGVFCLAGLVAGRRLKTLLLCCADEVVRRSSADNNATMSSADAFRVGVLARMAMVSLAFAGCLAVWAFNPFS